MNKEVENSPIIGRPKGSLNARTVDLLEITEKLECNPFETLLLFMKGDHEALGLEKYTVVSVTKDGEPIEKLTIGAELRQKSAKDACEYLFPKRKAIEHTGMEGKDLFTKLIEGLNGPKQP